MSKLVVINVLMRHNQEIAQQNSVEDPNSKILLRILFMFNYFF